MKKKIVGLVALVLSCSPQPNDLEEGCSNVDITTNKHYVRANRDVYSTETVKIYSCELDKEEDKQSGKYDYGVTF